MYLSDPSLIPAIAGGTHFSIFITEVELPKSACTFSGAIPIHPSDKSTHDIETIRSIESLARAKQSTRQTFVVYEAHKLTLAASNAFLKLLEEPGDNISFVFVASDLSAFPQTILSRAKVYHLRSREAPTPDPATLAQARTLVAGRQADLISLATTLAKDRSHAIAVTETAITELHRSQLQRPSPQFLARLDKLLSLHASLENNGHVKLNIVDMAC